MTLTASEIEREQRQYNRAKVIAEVGRDTAINRLTAISVLAMKVSSDHNLIPKFLAMSEDLDTLWDSFLTNNRDLLNALVDLEKISEFSTDLEGDVRCIYMSARELVLQHRPPVSNMSNSDSVQASANISNARRETRLPEIPLPTFSGNMLEWPVFHDCFDALIGQRTGLSDIERFYYLLGCLKDEALHTIANIPVSEAN